MKIEISYKNSVIGSLSAGESLALHLTDQKLTDDMVVKAVAEVKKLSAPTISISDGIISITNNNDVSVRYNVFINGENYAGTTVNATSVDLTSFALEAGTYSVYLTAFADGYEESEPSNTVEYVVEEEITDLTNTTWYFNETVLFNRTDVTSFVVALTFTSYFRSDYKYDYYTRITVSDSDGDGVAKLVYTTYVGSNYDTQTAFNNGVWNNEALRTITITGGTHVTDTTIIAWLKANAKKVS